MRTMKNAKRLAALWLACLLLAAAPAPARAGEGTILILEFLDLRASMRLSSLDRVEEVRQTQPALAEIIVASITQADPDEFPRRIAPLLDRALDADDIAAIVAFTKTPEGVMLAKIFKENKSQAALARALAEMPPRERAVAEKFFSTRPMVRLMEVITSPELHEVARLYGEELACRYAMARPELMDRARLSGKCKAVKPP